VVNKLAKNNDESKAIPKKRKHKRKKSISKNQKKQFVDEELLRTLEAHGFKRKSLVAQHVNSTKAIQKKKVVKKPAIKEEPKVEVYKKPEIEIETEMPQESEKKPLQEEQKPWYEFQRKPTFFERLSLLFKRKPKPEKIEPEPEIEEQKFEEPQPEVKEIMTEVKGETPKEIEQVEIKQEIKPEPEKIIEKPVEVQEVKEEVQRFPVTKEQENGISDEEIKKMTKFKEKKPSFFSRLMNRKKGEIDDLEPITIISGPDESVTYHENLDNLHIDNADQKKVSTVLKEEIMPKSQNKSENSSSSDSSSTDILFGDKRKKVPESAR